MAGTDEPTADGLCNDELPRTRDLTEAVQARDSVIVSLRESEGRYRELVENCGLMVLSYDSECRIRYMNTVCMEEMGLKGRDVIGKHVTEVLGPEIGGRVVARMAELLATGKTRPVTDYAMTPEGPRWLWAHPSVMRDSSGKVTGVTVFVQDITKEKEAEIKLAQSEEEFRHLVNYAGFIVVRCSLDGTIHFMNDMGLQYGGRRFTDVAGRNMRGVWHPTMSESFMGGIRRAMEKGKDIEMELEMSSPRGTRWFWSRYNLMKDAEGNIENIIFFAHDTTKQKLAEMELKWSEGKYRRLIEGCGLGVAVHDVETRFVMVNAAAERDFNRKAEDLIGRKITDVMPPPSGEHMADLLRQAIESGREIQTEDKLVYVTGPRWILSRLNPLRDAEGAVNGVLVFAQDITDHKLAQEQVRESEREYQELMETAGVAVTCFDNDFRVTLINSISAARFGKHPDEIIGRHISDIAPAELSEVIKGELCRVLETKQASEREMELGFPSGRRWYWYRMNPLYDTEGHATGIMVFAHDITERKLAQQKAVESEGKYQTLIERSGLAVSCYDREARLVMVNAVTEVHFGGTSEELLGRRLPDIIPPPYGQTMENMVLQVVATGRDAESEDDLMLPAGRRWILARANALRDVQGEVSGVVVFARDRTEQKLAQLALQESESRRRMLTDMAMEGIFMHEDGVLLEANPAFYEMFGYKPEEVVGKDVRPLILAPESIEPIVEHYRSSQGISVQATAMRKDGTRFQVETRGVDTQYKGRKVRVGVVTDISDRVMAETELAVIREKMATAERLAAVGYIGATMAHEINTPLSVMRLTLQMLIADMEKSGGKKANLEQAGTILREIDRTSAIMCRYREISRPAREIGDAAEEIRQVPDRVKQVFQEAAQRVKLRINIGDEVPELLTKLGNVNDAEQLMFVLVQNAVQAGDSRERETLNITGCIRDKNVELRFADNCCGIPHENLAKIFEPFYSTKPRNIGTGLGLSIVRRLLQERGGSIRVESELGKGTTFILTYPA